VCAFATVELAAAEETAGCGAGDDDAAAIHDVVADARGAAGHVDVGHSSDRAQLGEDEPHGVLVPAEPGDDCGGRTYGPPCVEQPERHWLGADAHVGGWLNVADDARGDVGLADADVITGGADETVQAAVAHGIAVKERVSPHAKVCQLLREVRAEAAEADQDDARIAQPLLSRFTKQRDLAVVPLA
jgi:hypothetical protein